MKYQYTVKHNGVWYPAGMEVPMDTHPVEDRPVEKPTEAAEEPKKAVVEKKGGRPRRKN